MYSVYHIFCSIITSTACRTTSLVATATISPTVYVRMPSSHNDTNTFTDTIHVRFSNGEGSAVAYTTFFSVRACLLTKFYLQ